MNIKTNVVFGIIAIAGNFILTPQIAGWTIESVDTTARIIGTNIERLAQAQIPLTIVNPELTY